MNHIELLHLNTVCHTLEEMDRSPQQRSQLLDPKMQGEAEDPFTYAQIHFLLFLYALLWRSTNVASHLLGSVFYVVERHNLRFVPEDKLARVQLA